MKKLTIFILILFFIPLVLSISAQTKTATPSSNIEEKEIQIFKEKIATKVAELRQKNNKAVSGVILAISDNNIKIKSPDNKEEYTIQLDEALTKYYQIIGNQKKEIKLSTLKKDDYIIAVGVTIDKTMNANAVYIDEQYLVGSGKIIEIDKNNYSLKVSTNDKESYIIEIEDYTKQAMLNIKTLEMERTGFSKIKEGDTIHFVAKKKISTKENRHSAYKILIIPQEYFMK